MPYTWYVYALVDSALFTCSMVSTKYGNVNTDHILFICSGAFHSCKPSDMLAELQGRLPIRVELKGLGREVTECQPVLDRTSVTPYPILLLNCVRCTQNGTESM